VITTARFIAPLRRVLLSNAGMLNREDKEAPE